MTDTNGVIKYNNNTKCATFILNRMISTLIILIISLKKDMRQISIQAKNEASHKKVAYKQLRQICLDIFKYSQD